MRQAFSVHPQAHDGGGLAEEVQVDVARLALLGHVFFAKGFEIEFAGVLNDGLFFVIDLDGENVFSHLMFFCRVEVERAE